MDAQRFVRMCGALALAAGLSACGVKGPPRPPKPESGSARRAPDRDRAAPPAGQTDENDQTGSPADGGVDGG